MAVNDQIKILDRKVMQNVAQHDLDRKAAKMSWLSSKNLPKYEHLTGKDLGYEPSALEQATFDYPPLGTIFSKGLNEEDKKKRLKHFEGKNEEQLKAIADQGNEQLNANKDISSGSKSLKSIGFFSGLSPEAKVFLDELKKDSKRS